MSSCQSSLYWGEPSSDGNSATSKSASLVTSTKRTSALTERFGTGPCSLGSGNSFSHSSFWFRHSPFPVGHWDLVIPSTFLPSFVIRLGRSMRVFLKIILWGGLFIGGMIVLAFAALFLYGFMENRHYAARPDTHDLPQQVTKLAAPYVAKRKNA